MRIAAAAIVVLGLGSASAADFGMPGGPEPENLATATALLRRDAYDVELLLSYGTSKGGSAGHIALAVSGELADDDVVYSANYYADRDARHAALYEARDLVL